MKSYDIILYNTFISPFEFVENLIYKVVTVETYIFSACKHAIFVNHHLEKVKTVFNPFVMMLSTPCGSWEPGGNTWGKKRIKKRGMVWLGRSVKKPPTSMRQEKSHIMGPAWMCT